MEGGGMNHVRLLPWTGAHGQPCLLLTDGDGTASRLAGRVEDARLGLAGRLLGRARDALATRNVTAGEVEALAVQLTDALADVSLIARSPGARLGGGAGPWLPAGVPPVASTVVASCGAAPGSPAVPGTPAVFDSPAVPRAHGLWFFPGGDLASAPAARRHVRDAADSWGLPRSVIDDLETIAGELVANALEHSDSHTITVDCGLTSRTAVISVTDEGGGPTPATLPTSAQLLGLEQERGRGLLITQALAVRWGTLWDGGELTVWAEVPLESPETAG